MRYVFYAAVLLSYWAFVWSDPSDPQTMSLMMMYLPFLSMTWAYSVYTIFRLKRWSSGAPIRYKASAMFVVGTMIAIGMHSIISVSVGFIHLTLTAAI
ncbi:hypothetical protein TW86_04175 [Halomonas sp. S2151]|uniref:hypothetical protein n=1 Tax=Halomonas sp. S2151 TaxID=579478 RepID=UPI0005FA365F|nr:hypothetical protein [Halomonas sp. S2151]KJZ17455.1 hypothetical protein TW86_04175 [Halomonas sp. S2151]